MPPPALLYWTAAFSTLAVAAAHVLLGGPVFVEPLLGATELPEGVRWLGYFVWHVGTVALLVMSVAFGYAALRPGNRAVALFATSMAAGFGVLGLGIALFHSPTLWNTPAPYAFFLVAALGGAGVVREPGVSA